MLGHKIPYWPSQLCSNHNLHLQANLSYDTITDW